MLAFELQQAARSRFQPNKPTVKCIYVCSMFLLNRLAPFVGGLFALGSIVAYAAIGEASERVHIDKLAWTETYICSKRHGDLECS